MIELGKYSATVLTAYGVSLALLIGIVIQSIRANAAARRALEAQERQSRDRQARESRAQDRQAREDRTGAGASPENPSQEHDHG